MARVLHRTASEGFVSLWIQEDDGRVHCVADADIDADGANGQHGAPAAYRADNKGTEDLANGGMRREPGGQVAWAAAWGPDIALSDQLGAPLVLPGGIVPSKTAWRDPSKSPNEPCAYADSETVPYLVVPSIVRMAAKGIVLGCRGQITDTRTGATVEAGVLDIGPRTKSGEMSIAAARALQVPSSPRTGGESKAVFRFEFWPGEAFCHEGFAFSLIRG